MPPKGVGAWETPRKLLEAFSQSRSSDTRERLERWARSNPGEVACLVLAKASLLEAFHLTYSHFEEGPALGKSGKPGPADEQQLQQQLSKELEVLNKLSQALEHAVRAATQYRSLLGLVLAAALLYLCRGRGNALQAMCRKQMVGNLQRLLTNPKAAGDACWSDPHQIPLLGDICPWEVEAKRTAPGKLTKDVSERLLRIPGDEDKAIAMAGKPQQAVACRSVEELAGSLGTPLLVRLAACESPAVFPGVLRASLFSLFMEKSGQLSKTVNGMRAQPSQVLAQQAQQLLREERKARALRKLEQRRTQQETAPAAAQSVAPARRGSTGAGAGGGCIDQATLLARHLEGKLQGLLPRTKGDCREAVRQVASISCIELALEADRLREGGSWSTEQEQYVQGLVSRVKQGSPRRYRLQLPAELVAAAPAGVGNGAGAGGAGGKDAGSVEAPSWLEASALARFQDLILERLSAAVLSQDGSEEGAIEAEAPLVGHALAVIVAEWKKWQAAAQDHEGGSGLAESTFPRPRVLSLPAAPGIETFRKPPLRPEDQKLLQELEQQGAGAGAFSAACVLDCVPCPLAPSVTRPRGSTNSSSKAHGDVQWSDSSDGEEQERGAQEEEEGEDQGFQTGGGAGGSGRGRAGRRLPLADAYMFRFYNEYVHKLECALPLRLPTCLDWSSCHPHAHDFTHSSHPLLLLRSVLARAVAGRHMLRLLARLQQGEEPEMGFLRGLQGVLCTPGLSPADVISALEDPAVGAGACQVAGCLLLEASGDWRKRGLLVQGGARLLLCLLAAEHAQQGVGAFDEAWVGQAKARLALELVTGVRQLSQRGRLTEVMAAVLGSVAASAVAQARGQEGESDETGNPEALGEALRALHLLPLPALAQLHCLLCLWTAQRFLDLVDLQPDLQELLVGDAAPAVEVTHGDVIQLTPGALDQLVAPAPLSSEGCAPPEECAARLAAYCQPGTASHSAPCFSAAKGSDLSTAAPSPAWGPAPPATSQQQRSTAGSSSHHRPCHPMPATQRGAPAAQLPPLGCALPGSGNELAGGDRGRGAGAGAGALEVPGAGQEVGRLLGLLRQQLYLQGALGCLEGLLQRTAGITRDVLQTVADLQAALLQEEVNPAYFTAGALERLQAAVIVQEQQCTVAALCASLLDNAMMARSAERDRAGAVAELAVLKPWAKRHAAGLGPEQREELGRRLDWMQFLTSDEHGHKVSSFGMEARTDKEKLDACRHCPPRLLLDNNKCSPLLQHTEEYAARLANCTSLLEIRVFFSSERANLLSILASLAQEVVESRETCHTLLNLGVRPSHDWAWAEAQQLAALLARRCLEDPPALLARAVLQHALPGRWRREIAEAAADNSDAWLQELLKEENEKKAKAAVALEKKRAKRQAQKARAAEGATRQQQQQQQKQQKQQKEEGINEAVEPLDPPQEEEVEPEQQLVLAVARTACSDVSEAARDAPGGQRQQQQQQWQQPEEQEQQRQQQQRRRVGGRAVVHSGPPAGMDSSQEPGDNVVGRSVAQQAQQAQRLGRRKAVSPKQRLGAERPMAAEASITGKGMEQEGGRCAAPAGHMPAMSQQAQQEEAPWSPGSGGVDSDTGSMRSALSEASASEPGSPLVQVSSTAVSPRHDIGGPAPYKTNGAAVAPAPAAAQHAGQAQHEEPRLGRAGSETPGTPPRAGEQASKLAPPRDSRVPGVGASRLGKEIDEQEPAVYSGPLEEGLVPESSSSRSSSLGPEAQHGRQERQQQQQQQQQQRRQQPCGQPEHGHSPQETSTAAPELPTPQGVDALLSSHSEGVLTPAADAWTPAPRSRAGRKKQNSGKLADARAVAPQEAVVGSEAWAQQGAQQLQPQHPQQQQRQQRQQQQPQQQARPHAQQHQAQRQLQQSRAPQQSVEQQQQQQHQRWQQPNKPPSQPGPRIGRGSDTAQHPQHAAGSTAASNRGGEPGWRAGAASHRDAHSSDSWATGDGGWPGSRAWGANGASDDSWDWKPSGADRLNSAQQQQQQHAVSAPPEPLPPPFLPPPPQQQPQTQMPSVHAALFPGVSQQPLGSPVAPEESITPPTAAPAGAASVLGPPLSPLPRTTSSNDPTAAFPLPSRFANGDLPARGFLLPRSSSSGGGPGPPSSTPAATLPVSMPLPGWQSAPAVPAVEPAGGAEGAGEDDLSAMLAAMGVGMLGDDESPSPSQAQQAQHAEQHAAWPVPSSGAGTSAYASAAGAGGPILPPHHLLSAGRGKQPAWGPGRHHASTGSVAIAPAPAVASSFAIPGAVSVGPVWAAAASAAGAAAAAASEGQGGSGDRVTEEVGLAAAGLSNEAGEYNCFLNVIIQCLWHCSDFRREVESWAPAFYQADPVVHALRDLFASLAGQERAQQAQRQRGVVNPNCLREALSGGVPSQSFRVGEMNDAGEVLLTVYERIRALALAQGRDSLVDRVFGLGVTEAVNCHSCGHTTHQSQYTQYFYNTQATSVRLQQLASARDDPTLGQLLRAIERQSQKTCDTDERGCGAWNPINHFLDRAPRVFTLQLAWESYREGAGDIAATLAGIQEQVDLGHIYHALDAGQHVYRLRSMVGYYGAHYFAFVLVPDLGRWLMFDDTRVTSVGAWADVRRKCELGHIQPSVLFFASDH